MKQFACNLFFIGDGGPTFFFETGTRLDTDFRDFFRAERSEANLLFFLLRAAENGQFLVWIM